MITKRRKVKSTAFSDFVRNASYREKSDFFQKVIEEVTQKQKEVIAKANEIDGYVYGMLYLFTNIGTKTALVPRDLTACRISRCHQTTRLCSVERKEILPDIGV